MEENKLVERKQEVEYEDGWVKKGFCFTFGAGLAIMAYFIIFLVFKLFVLGILFS